MLSGSAFDAKKVWEEFYKKFPSEFTEEEKKQLFPDKKPVDQKAIEKKEIKEATDKEKTKASKRIQSFWRAKTTLIGMNSLIPVRVGKAHSADFVEMVHGQKIKKSIHSEKLKALKNALDKGNWNASIFEDAHLPQLTMTLFSHRKINQQQAATILERVQTFKDHPHIRTVAILDAKGDFTREAQEILIPSLAGKVFPELKGDLLNEFKLLILELPPSERFFYITQAGKYKGKKWNALTRDLGLDLIQNEFIYRNKMDDNNQLIHLTSGVRDAWGITWFGMSNYVRMVPTLGEKNKDEIEVGVRKRKRFGALNYPGTIPYGDIHGYPGVTDFEATGHDVYHAMIMSSLTYRILDVFLQLIEATRTAVKGDIKVSTDAKEVWSKEIWEWLDGEFKLLFSKLRDVHILIKTNSLPILDICCSLFLHADNFLFPKRRNYFVRESKNDKYDISVLGVIFLLDWIKNRAAWLKLGINLEETKPGPIKEFYHEIKELYEKINQDQPKMQIIKILLYQTLKMQVGRIEKFKTLSETLTAHADYFCLLIQFKKVSKKEDSLLKNSIYIAFAGIPISTQPEKNTGLLAIVETIARLKKDNNYQENPDLVNIKKAILDSDLHLQYNQHELDRYIQEMRKSHASPLEIQYRVKPSLWRWMKVHPIKSLLSLMLIPLFYGNYQIWQQKKKNQLLSSKPLLSMTTKKVSDGLKEGGAGIIPLAKNDNDFSETFGKPYLAHSKFFTHSVSHPESHGHGIRRRRRGKR